MKTIDNWAKCLSRGSLLVILLVLATSGKGQELMRTNLYAIKSTGLLLMDGTLTEYGDEYSNKVDMDDALKMINPEVNFGILRASKTLVVERRKIYTLTDTTCFRMWNLPPQSYRLKLMLKNLDHAGRRGVLKDSYLGTETTISLNDTTEYEFTVDGNPASSAELRFQLVYIPQKPVKKKDPVWYLSSDITIYPNPVTGRMVQVQFGGQVAGNYNLLLVSTDGMEYQLPAQQLGTGPITRSVKLPYYLRRGIYRLQITGPDNSRTTKTIFLSE